MDRISSLLPASAILLLIIILNETPSVYGNAEGDALYALKTKLSDPNNVLQSWDPTLPNPCSWLHITCNNENSVTRIDLGHANFSGQLASELGQLANLQYLYLFGNNITGTIPNAIGNLTNLVSLGLNLNRLHGHIPTTLGNLQKLRHLRLNNNALTGRIPYSLTTITTLEVLDLSSNDLRGIVPLNGSFLLFTPRSFANNPKLIFPAYVGLAPAPALTPMNL